MLSRTHCFVPKSIKTEPAAQLGATVPCWIHRLPLNNAFNERCSTAASLPAGYTLRHRVLESLG